MQSAMAIIDVDIYGTQDEQTRETLLQNLQAYKGDSVRLLWVNWLRERADLRVVCMVNDLADLDNFLVRVIRSTPGVRGTAAYLAFAGMTNARAITELPLQATASSRRAAATVFITLEPGQDEMAYQALLALPRHREVEVAFVFKLLHSPRADALLLLMGDRTAALTGYVMSWVRTIPGVADTELMSVLDWQILGKMDDFVSVVERFEEQKKAG